ncbi:unnamed protein product [Ixodes hexagonus]
MDRILAGIVKSDHPEDVKRNLIEMKLIPAASQPMAPGDCESLLEVSWNLATTGETEFFQNGGISVFAAFCEHHKSALTKFFTQSHLITALTSPGVVHKDRMLQLVTGVLSQMEREPVFPKLCCVVQTRCISLLKETCGSLAVCCSMVTLLERFPQCLPKEEFRGKLCSVLTQCVVASPCPSQAQDLKPYITDINRVAMFLKSVWTLSESALRRTLETVSVILTSKDEKFSTALAAIIDLFPSSLVPAATSSLSKSLVNGYDVEPLVLASERLLACLSWPGTSTVDVWVLAALRGFLFTGRFGAVHELFNSQVKVVFNRVTHPLTRKCAFPVLSFMLLSYQHSPSLFHQVVPHVPLLVELLKKEKNEDSILEVASLSQTLMYLHSGFPDLYDPVLDAIKDVAPPLQEEMQNLLAMYRMDVPEKYVGGIVGDVSTMSRREDELVGLVNLGNTCYANSVLQALYMTSRLRNELLQTNSIPGGTNLKRLQELFAFLMLSQRPAVSPESFLCKSKPPWFELGEQQDCSEFLRFLVDSLHEEHKAHRLWRPTGDHKGGGTGRTLIEEVFGGSVKTTYHCLTCGSDSTNEEAITDLHLAFPEGTVTKGGGMDAKTYQTRSTTKEGGSGEEPATPRAPSVEDLLESYFEPESMEGDNKYHCNTCDALRDARRTVALAEPPRHLILTLMRFSYDNATRTRSKILHNVAYPQLLVLPENSGLGERAAYALYAVVVHSGTSADRGHYYTYARHSSQESLSPRKSAYRPSTSDLDPLSKKWYLFNDSRVSNASYATFETLTRRFPKDTAYVLFYKHINSSLAYQEAAAPERPDDVHASLRELVDRDNLKYLEEQEAKSKRARFSYGRTNHNGDSSEGGPSPPTGGCGGGMGGGLGDFPRVVF